MRVFGIAGWSGSGKITLLSRLIPLLVAQGYRVSTIKHAYHEFDIDQPGKDSHTHRLAGGRDGGDGRVRPTMGADAELREKPKPDLAELLALMSPVDLVLVEGFKRHAGPKLEVHRPSLGEPLLQANDPYVLGVASCAALDLLMPVIDLENVSEIARFVTAHASWVGTG